MKLHLAQQSRRNIFTAYGNGYVAVNGTRYESSLIVMPDKIVADWAVPSVPFLSHANLDTIASLKPELILLGTGELLRFPDATLLGHLIAARVGIEVMDSKAACRTYNILAEEGRNVAAALIIPGT